MQEGARAGASMSAVVMALHWAASHASCAATAQGRRGKYERCCNGVALGSVPCKLRSDCASAYLYFYSFPSHDALTAEPPEKKLFHCIKHFYKFLVSCIAMCINKNDEPEKNIFETYSKYILNIHMYTMLKL